MPSAHIAEIGTMTKKKTLLVSLCIIFNHKSVTIGKQIMSFLQ